MTNIARTPVWIRIAAAVMVGEDLGWLVLHPTIALGAVSLGVVVLLAWFLLRGSRVAWVLAVFWAATQLAAPFTMNQPVWLVGTAAIVLACLLAPPSYTFIWTERRSRAKVPWRSDAQRSYGRILDLAFDSAARVARLGRGKLIGVLAVCVLILVPLDGALYNLHHGSGDGNVIVDVLWRVVSVVDGLAQLALIVLLAMVVHGFAVRTIRGPNSSGA